MNHYSSKWLDLLHKQPILIAALAFGLFAGAYNFVQKDMVITFLVVLLLSGMLGFLKPKRAWLWAGIIGISIPIGSILGLLIGIEAPVVRFAREKAATGFGFAVLSVLFSLILVFATEACAAIGLTARKTLSRISSNGQ